MGKSNGCLKCLFIFFNTVFAILGCLMICALAGAKTFSRAEFGGLVLGWIFAFAVLGISCLGIYAGCIEKESALKKFAGFMMAALVFILSWGTYFAIKRHIVKNDFTNEASEAFKSYMEDDEYRTMLNKTQASAKCCGLSGAEDWGSEIPQSCACDGSSGGLRLGECELRPQNTTGPLQVFAKTCRKALFNEIDVTLETSMRSVFILTAIPLLQLVLSTVMLHQVKPPPPPPTVVW